MLERSHRGKADYPLVPAIDADAGMAKRASYSAGVNDAFSRVVSFSTVAGQFALAFDAGGNATLLPGETDGNGVADFSVLFTGHVTALTAGWVLQEDAEQSPYR